MWLAQGLDFQKAEDVLRIPKSNLVILDFDLEFLDRQGPIVLLRQHMHGQHGDFSLNFYGCSCYRPFCNGLHCKSSSLLACLRDEVWRLQRCSLRHRGHFLKQSALNWVLLDCERWDKITFF